MSGGNPFKPKASGVTGDQKIIADVSAVVGQVFERLHGSMENLYLGFRHLTEAINNTIKNVTRLGLTAAIMAGGPRNPIPYDIRDLSRGALRSKGSGRGKADGNPFVSDANGPPPPGDNPIAAVQQTMANSQAENLKEVVSNITGSSLEELEEKLKENRKRQEIVKRKIEKAYDRPEDKLDEVHIEELARRANSLSAREKKLQNAISVMSSQNAMQGPEDPNIVSTGANFVGPPKPPGVPPVSAPGGGGGGPNDPRSFWRRFFEAGAEKGKNFWRTIWPSGSFSKWAENNVPSNKDQAKVFKDALVQGLQRVFFGSAIGSALLLRAGSPLAADTLHKSFELALAKLSRGTLGQTGWMSRNLQQFSGWADRYPDTAGLLGKALILTTVVGGAIIGISIMAKAANTAAASLMYLARSAGIRGAVGRRTPVPPVIPAPGGAPGIVSNAAKGTGSAANSIGAGSRLGRIAGAAGKFATPLTLVLAGADAIDNASGMFIENQPKKYSANNWMMGLPNNFDFFTVPLGNAMYSKKSPGDTSGFGGRLRKEFIRNNVGVFTTFPEQASLNRNLEHTTGYSSEWLQTADRMLGVDVAVVGGRKINKWLSDIEEYFDYSRSFNNAGMVPGMGMDGQKLQEAMKGTNRIKLGDLGIEPSYQNIEDVYKQVQLSVLQSQLEQEITTERRQQDLQFMSDAVKSGFDNSEVGKQLVKNGPALKAR